MRKVKSIQALFPATRAKILAAVLMHPQHWWYLSDLAKHLNLSPSSLQRELSRLTEGGILSQRRDAKRVYYRPDPACPLLEELTGILIKTAGITDVLHGMLKPFSRNIRLAFIYGSIAESQELSGSDIDLFVIGSVGLSELAPALRRAEKKLAREINTVVYNQREFMQKKHKGHHFINQVIEGKKLVILGDARELEKAGK